MIKVSVLYPGGEGKTFNMDYYCNEHMALVKEKVGDAIKGVAVEAGLGGAEPGSPPVYVAMGHLYFESLDAFQTFFGPHAGEIMADIPNYTNIQPVIQISEVKM